MVGVIIKAAVRVGSTAEASVSFLYSRPPMPDAKYPELTAGTRVQVTPCGPGNSLRVTPAVLPEGAGLTPW